jgi:stage II sporulation protein D
VQYARILAIVVVAGLLAAACGPLPPRAPSPPAPVVPTEILVRSKGQIGAVSLEDYTLATVLSEVSPVGENAATVDRIFQVQAIVARTYAVSELGRHRADGFDLCDSTHCQLYDPARIATSRFASAARAAVQATAGEVLLYQNRVAAVFFHADCGGVTTTASDVWGGTPMPYLLSAPDVIAPAKHRAWTATLSSTDLLRAFNADPASSVGKHLDGLEVRTRDTSGRAESIALRSDTTRVLAGDAFRAIVNRTLGDRTIDSTKFVLTQQGTRYTFTGTGFGHGVGLCQLGAAARARRGDAVTDILSQYFPGTTLKK